MPDITTLRSDLLREEYTVVRHQSGLTVYLFPKALSTTYALLATRFGSIDNRFRTGKESDLTVLPDGVAHFLEHKMFENEDGEDTFVKFARTGANANAYTGFRSTAYLFSCADGLYPSLEILLRSVFSPYFTEENVKKEQGIIAQEIRMGEDDPYNALQYGMLKGLYEHHSARIDIAGTVPSILKITPELLYRCHKVFYHPGNMVLCVCGRAELNRVLAVVDRTVAVTEPVAFERVYAEESPAAFRSRVTRRMPVAKPLFAIGVKDVAISADPDQRMIKDLAIQLIAAMAFGKSGRFYNELYEAGLISPGFDLWTWHNPAFSFFSVMGDSPDPEEVFRRFTAYAETLATTPFDPKDFERCRRALYANYVKSFDSTEEIANNLVTDFALDGCDIFRFGELLRDIDVDTVSRTAAALFRPEAYTLSTVLPVED